MASTNTFTYTLGDINFILDQLRTAIVVLKLTADGKPVYGYVDSAGVSHELGLFGTFDPLAVKDAVTGLPIYDGARDASGLRFVNGAFNNLTSDAGWLWGSAGNAFARLTQSQFDNYVQQVVDNPALAAYAAHPGFVPVADNSLNYADPMKTVVDYTPRMIAQTISSSYDAHAPGVADSALVRTEAASPGLVTDVITSQVVGADGTTTTVQEHIARNLNTLPGDPSTSGIFTLFGQFFDHGLDFIDKGGQGSKVVIPLSPGDPLYRAPGTNGPTDPSNTTITVSRATPDGYTVTDLHGRALSIAGADGQWGTADDVKGGGLDGQYGTADDEHGAMAKPTGPASYTDHTSPYIDQNQTYGSDAQITNLLREWVRDPNTGQFRPGAEMFDGHQVKAYSSGTFDDAGAGLSTRTVPTLDELRAHLLATGRDDLTWDDVNNYRARDEHGRVIDTNGAAAGGYVYTGQAVLLDMNPDFALVNWSNPIIAAGGITAGNWMSFVNFANFTIKDTVGGVPVTAAQYAAVGEALMEAVGHHYVAGDGRANENFGLTALHHVFHENHNVQLANLEKAILAKGTLDERHGLQLAVGDGHGGTYTDAAGNYTLADRTTVSWDPEKMFQAAKLVNEMEYQHVAIDQYARLVTPDLPEFVTYDNNVNADISLEYGQGAFRFGHSQLRETIDAIDPSGRVTKYALSGAFLNPDLFGKVGAADILRGMSQQVSNEVDEFVTPALQQSLLGQSLDLAAINIARGRDLGLPTLNQVRHQLHDALVAERASNPQTPHHTNLIVDALNPYTSWAEFGSQMQHPASLVNFIAAYSFDGDIAKAQAIVGLENGSIAEGSAEAQGFTVSDAIQFLNGGDKGYDKVDFWIGGLAEIHVFLGQLGSTFNAIFEDQMERLMDGDRFYYLYRLGASGAGAFAVDTDLGHSIVTEQFKDIIERTTGVKHLNGDVMGYADSTLELDRTVDPTRPLLAVRGEQVYDATGHLVTANQGDLKYDASGHLILQDARTAHAYGDILAANPGLGIYSGAGGGTAGNGTLISKFNAESGHGTQQYVADFRPDMGENPDGTAASGYNSHEVLSGTKSNDWIDAGNGDDTIYGDEGDDILDGKAGADHIYGGDGNDLIFGGDIEDFLDGGNGDDIVYAGTSAGALDVVIGGAGNDRLYGEAGIDEMYGGAGDDYIDAGGDTDLAFGDAGNDQMFGGDGPDELRGGLGDDIIAGGSGPDKLLGEGGDDIIMPGIGQSAQTGDSDEALGDVGFDMVSLADVTIKLDVAADLRNQNLTAAGGATPFEPFNQLWTDIEGVVGSKFADRIIGADAGTADASGVQPGDNWLIGGSGDDVLQGRGGNDVIVGGSIRLDTLIGTYKFNGAADLYASDVDGASHRVGANAVLSGGLLDVAGGDGVTFAKHYTDLLRSAAYKDFAFGDGGVQGGSDSAAYAGHRTDYDVRPLSFTDPLGNAMTAFLVKDLRPGSPDGTDLLVGVSKLVFDYDETTGTGTTVTIQDATNQAPQFTSAAVNGTFAEFAANPVTAGQGQTPAGTVVATLAAKDTLTPGQVALGVGPTPVTFSIVNPDAATAGLFALTDATSVTNGNTTTGGAKLTFAQAPDFEALKAAGAIVVQSGLHAGQLQLTVHVQASDGVSSTVQDATVYVSNVDEKASGAIHFAGASVTGNSVTFTGSPGDLSDPDVAGTPALTYGLSGNGAPASGLVYAGPTNASGGIHEFQLKGTYLQPSLAAATALSPEKAFVGTGVADTLNGTAGADLLVGLNGNDTYKVNNVGDVVVEGVNGGTDEVQVSIGSYTLTANVENLTYVGTGDFTGTGNALANTVTGGVGKDTFVATVDGVRDTYNGGAGTDTADYSAYGSGSALTVNFGSVSPAGYVTVAGSGAANDVIGNVENFVGGSGNDTVVAARDDVANVFDGGAGSDTASYAAYATGLRVDFGTAGGAVVVGSGSAGSTSDTLRNIENFTGGSGADAVVAASDGLAHLYDGRGGIDTLDLSRLGANLTFDLRNAGTQQAVGGATNVTAVNFENVTGGSGSDTVTAGAGVNTFIGGAGADTLVFASAGQLGNNANRDVFADFKPGEDKVNLAGVDANSGAAGVQHFTFNDSTALWNGTGNEFGSNSAGQIRYHYAAVNGVDHTILDLHTTAGQGGATYQVDLGEGRKVIHVGDLVLA